MTCFAKGSEKPTLLDNTTVPKKHNVDSQYMRAVSSWRRAHGYIAPPPPAAMPMSDPQHSNVP